MFILARYILKEHIAPFIFSLAVIMFVFVTKFIVQYIGKIFGKGLSFITILEFIYLNLAWMMALAVPMAVLIAALMGFGRLSADNEITILKTSGISLYKIIRPVLLAGVALTIIMYWFNDRVLPEYNHRARLLYVSISQKKPTLQLEPGIYLNLGNFSILVQNIEKSFGEELVDRTNIMGPELEQPGTDRLIDVTIFDRSDEDVQRTVIAKSGYLVFDRKREQLVLTLFNGEIHQINNKDFSEYRRLRFVRNVFYIPAPELVFKKTDDEWRSDREMSTAMMNQEVSKLDTSIASESKTIKTVLDRYFKISFEKIARYRPEPGAQLNIASELAVADSNPALPADPGFAAMQQTRSRTLRKTQAAIQQLENINKNTTYYERQINKLDVEIYKKLSIPFASIVFVLIGAPLGIRAKKGSLAVGATFSVGFFLLYWVFLIGGEELADRMLVHPFISMWLANIIVGCFGAYLTYRTVKETTFIQWEKLPKFLQVFFRGEEAHK